MQPKLADQPSPRPIVCNGGEVNLYAVSPGSGLSGEDGAEFVSTVSIDVAQLGYFLHAAAPIPQAADENDQVENARNVAADLCGLSCAKSRLMRSSSRARASAQLLA